MSVILMMGYKLVFSYKVVSSMLNYLVSMGLIVEVVVGKYNISWEVVDEFVYNFYVKVVVVIDGGKFKSQIVFVEVDYVFVKNNKRVFIM